MTIFDVNFSQTWELNYPNKLRKPKALAWGNVLLKPLQYLRDLVFDDYATGSTYGIYSSISAYTAGNRVIYSNRGVYENLTGSTAALPTDVFSWKKINDNFIGARERIKYNSQIMVYEYAINKWFQTTGITISTQSLPTNYMLMGQTSQYSTYMSVSTIQSATTVAYMAKVYSANTSHQYTIFVPTPFFTGLTTPYSYSGASNIIRSFANTVNLAGMNYNVLPY